MFTFIALTATPVVILANRVHPTVIKIPFFLLWAIAAPFLAFLFSTVYTRIMNKQDSNDTQQSTEFDGEEN